MQIIILFIIIILSIIISKYVKKENQYLWSIYANISFVLVFFVTAINYINNQNKIEKEKEKLYADNILKEMTLIDDYLFKYYDDLKIPFAIMYNKIQFPSSDSNLNKEYKNLSKKSKDLTFLLFNKITYLLEQIYLLDKGLFDNSILGLKIQLYINNSMYYEYWHTNKVLFNTDFHTFMKNQYNYLSLENSKYNKPDNNIYFIPKIDKYNFNYN